MTSPVPRAPTAGIQIIRSLLARASILDGTRVVDRYVRHGLRIRTIQWTADKGFFLNGEHVYLRGATCVRTGRAGRRRRRHDTRARRRADEQAGFNFVRGSHYPHAPSFSEAVRSAGDAVLVRERLLEHVQWSAGGLLERERLSDQSERPTGVRGQRANSNLRDGPDRCNHPSIIVGSICNEPFFSAASVMPRVRTLLRELVDLTHGLDATRPAALGGVQRPIDSNRLDAIGDVAGYNGDGAAIAAFQDPGVPNMVSEYGSTTSDRPGDYAPGWGDWPRSAVRPFIRGVPARPSGPVSISGSLMRDEYARMGIVDYFRIPKRSWYWSPQRLCARPAAGVARTGNTRTTRPSRGQDGADRDRRQGRRLAARDRARRRRKDNQPGPDHHAEGGDGPGEVPTRPVDRVRQAATFGSRTGRPR